MCFGHVAEIRQFCYVQEMKTLSKYFIQLCAPDDGPKRHETCRIWFFIILF